MTTDTIDWTEKYEELHDVLHARYRWVDRELEEKAWSIIQPLSRQIWSIMRQKLTNDNHEELAKQAYCVAVQAVLYHLDKLDTR